ncbi:MAG TPA: methyltransferase domain-containing protein [Ferruginibacter sp.]|nr:methyltransferase domain-containing protein [Ferruginibacter sp.]
MKYLIFLPFWLFVISTFGQNLQKKQKTDSLTTAKFNITSKFLDLSPADIIADIGTGTGYSLIPIANSCPACKFIVQDIDSLSCNAKSLTKKINNTGKKTSIENFEFHYGTEKTTNLPSLKFNKVLIFDVIHEMTYKTEMLNDIKRILQKNGSIFIEEILVHKPVKKDKVCNYPFLTEVEFKKLLVGNNLIIKRESVTFDTGNNKYIKIFECVPLP